MSDDDLRERAAKMSAEGKTYADIAEQFARDRVPGVWTRSSVERFMRGEPEPVASTAPSAGATVAAAGDPVVAALARIEAHAASSAGWLSVIGWIVVAWAVLSLASAVWIANEVAGLGDESGEVATATTYAECLADPDTTMEDCEDLE